MDSAMVFTRPFDVRDLYAGPHLRTAALPLEKASWYGHLRALGVPGWLDGKLGSLADSYEAICEVLGNHSCLTNDHTGGTGIFDSAILFELEALANAKGFDGFSGLIRYSPYEFHWYGEFVYTWHQSKFYPIGPCLMTPCISDSDFQTLREGQLLSNPEHIGVLFQPPASERLEEAREILAEKYSTQAIVSVQPK